MVTDRYRLPELNAARPMNHSVIPADTQSRRLLIALAILLRCPWCSSGKEQRFLVWYQRSQADSESSQSIANPTAAIPHSPRNLQRQ